MKAAVVCLGILIATNAWAASAQSSRKITIQGLASDSSGNGIEVYVTDDERLPAMDNADVFGHDLNYTSFFYCLGHGADLASMFNFPVNPALSSASLTADVAALVNAGTLQCFGNAPIPTTVTMTCAANGQYFENNEGNGSSNFTNGDGTLSKYHFIYRIISANCTITADDQTYDVPAGVPPGSLIWYTQYADH